MKLPRTCPYEEVMASVESIDSSCIQIIRYCIITHRAEKKIDRYQFSNSYYLVIPHSQMEHTQGNDSTKRYIFLSIIESAEQKRYMLSIFCFSPLFSSWTFSLHESIKYAWWVCVCHFTDVIE